MANLTLPMDDDMWQRVTARAAEVGKSVDRLVLDYLEAFAKSDSPDVRSRILGLSRAASSSSGSGGRSWDRESLYS